MTKRVISGALYAIVVLAILFVSSYEKPIAAIIMFIIMALLAAKELLKTLKENPSGAEKTLYFMAILSFLPAYIFRSRLFDVNYLKAVSHRLFDSGDFLPGVISAAQAFNVVVLCFTFFLFIMGSSFFYKAIKQGPESAMSVLRQAGAALYIFLPFLCASLLLCVYHGGHKWLVLAVLTPWVADTAAYFVGSRYGRRNIFVKISPKKTKIGFISALLASAILYFIFAAAWVLPGHSLSFFEGLGILLLFMILGVAVATISQMGDLFASVLKRNAGIKDFGDIIPGHGGMLDRIDSMLFSIPAVFLLYIISLSLLGAYAV